MDDRSSYLRYAETLERFGVSLDLVIQAENAVSSEAASGALPLALALPLLWSQHYALGDVLCLSAEKLLLVTSTGLEDLRLRYQGVEPVPLRVPVQLWARTVTYFAQRISIEETDEQLDAIASQWCSTSVFVDRDGQEWTVEAFLSAVHAHQNASLAV